MKILVCSEFFIPKIGGIEISVYHIVSELTKKGYSVDLLTRSERDDSVKEYPIPNINFLTYSINLKRNNPFYYKKRLEILREKISKKKLEYDLIISRDPLASLALANEGMKIIYIPGSIETLFFDGFNIKRGIYYNLKMVYRKMRMDLLHRYEKEVLNHPMVEISLFSKNFEQILLAEGLATNKEIFINRPGIAVAGSEDTTERQKEWQEKNIFLYLGRIVSVKNVDLIISSFKKAKLNKSILLIIGEGDQYEYIKKLAAEDSRIYVLGKKYNIQHFYKIADFTITASRFETFGHIIHESLKLGTPVIGFRNKSNSLVAFEEIFNDSKAGILIENLNEKELRLAMEYAESIHLSKEYDVLKQNGLEYIERQTWGNYIDRLFEQYV